MQYQQSISLFVICCFAAILYIIGTRSEQFIIDQQWMSIDVKVSDAYYGEDPDVMFDREIHQNFQGKWTVEILEADTQRLVCSSSHDQNYKAEGMTSFTRSLFAWWMFNGSTPDKYCYPGEYPLNIGCYVVVTFWTVFNSTSGNFLITNNSNEFCIKER